MNKEDFIEIGIDTCVFDEYDNGAVFTCTNRVDDWIVCMRAVEQATLERAAEKLAAQHTWITNIAASQLVLALKDSHD